MYRLSSFVLLFVIYICLFYRVSETVKVKDSFETIIKDARNCQNPDPPFGKRPPVVSNYTITTVNGKRYLNGKTRVIANVPFLNFSGRTYEVDSAGNRTLKFQITQVSCRSILVKTILMFTNLTLHPKTCVMKKGVYEWNHVDLDKASHAMLSWHAPGELVHQLQLVFKGVTLICNEIYATVRPLSLK